MNHKGLDVLFLKLVSHRITQIEQSGTVFEGKAHRFGTSCCFRELFPVYLLLRPNWGVWSITPSTLCFSLTSSLNVGFTLWSLGIWEQRWPSSKTKRECTGPHLFTLMPAWLFGCYGYVPLDFLCKVQIRGGGRGSIALPWCLLCCVSCSRTASSFSESIYFFDCF